MKRIVAFALSAAMLFAASPSGEAAPKMKQLGTDAALDGPPGGDVTSLAVGKEGKNLVIEMGMTFVPAQGGIPGSGAEWSFTIGPRTFVAEGHPEGGGEYSFHLYQVSGEFFEEIATVEGAVDTIAGTQTMLIPLKLIGGKRGSVVRGAGDGDVDVHLHASAASRVLDTMTTEGSFRIP